MAWGLLNEFDIATLILLLGLSWIYSIFFRKYTKTLEEYYITGRITPWWMVGIDLASVALDIGNLYFTLTWCYAWGLFGFSQNMPWGWVAGSWFLSMWILPAMYRLGVITNTTWLEKRFDPYMRQLAAWMQILQRSYVLSGMLIGIAILFEVTTGMQFYEGIALAGAISVIATAVGGKIYLMASQVVQATFSMIAGFVLLFFVIMKLGLSNFIGAIAPYMHWVKVPIEVVKGVPNEIAFIGMVLVCATYGIINQEYISKALSGRSEYEARTALFFPNMLVWSLWMLPFALLGILGRELYPGVKPADYVLGYFVRDYIPIGLLGFVIGSFIATSADFGSTTQTIASLLTVDFYKRYIKKEAPEAHYVKLSKILTILWCIIPAIWVPFQMALPFVAMLYIMVTGALVTPTFIPYVVGSVSRFFSRKSAFIGCISGGIVGLFISIVNSFVTPLPSWLSHSWMVPIYSTSICLIVMVIVSVIENKVKGPIPDEELIGAIITLPTKYVKTKSMQTILNSRIQKIHLSNSSSTPINNML
ncbi:MAG: hypothetical protein QXL51_07400 [Candidatus Aenigmatarchaeota archaeon]